MNGQVYYPPPDYYGYPQQMEQPYQPQNKTPIHPNSQTNCDFVLVTNLDQVKAYIVYPGQKLYFLDINKSIIFTKEASNLGTTNIEAFNVTKVNLEDIDNVANLSVIPQNDSRIDDIVARLEVLEKRYERNENNKENRGYNNGAKSDKR